MINNRSSFNYKLLFIGLLLFCFNPKVAQACPRTRNPRSLAYVRRENNRCEGLQRRNISSSTFDLISFSTSNIYRYPKTLNIRVRGTGRTRPIIEVQSFFRNYRLDRVKARYTAFGFNFPLKTGVLRRAAIPWRKLRSLAYINRNSNRIYFPVILGKSSGKYKFIINSPRRNTFPIFKIRRNGRTILSKPRKTPRRGHITLTWKYGKAPAGIYELYIVNGKGKRRTFRFRHNPRWL